MYVEIVGGGKSVYRCEAPEFDSRGLAVTMDYYENQEEFAYFLNSLLANE